MFYNEDCNIRMSPGIGDFEKSEISKRKGRLLNTIIDFENINILKERDGDNLGDGKFSGFPKMGDVPGILKEREGF